MTWLGHITKRIRRLSPDATGYRHGMTILLILLVLLAVLGVLGAVIEGLLWLTLIAVTLLVVAGVFGWFKLRKLRTE